MATVEIDIIEESGLRHTSEGYEKTRVAMVSGISGGSDSAREYDALNASGVPVRGEFHPSIPFIRVQDRTAKAEGPDLVKVTLVYRNTTASAVEELQETDDPLLEISGSLESSTTDTDKEGTLITVDYAGDADNKAIASYVQPVQWSRPHGLVRFTRRERITDSQAQALVNSYVGKVNASSFGPFAARTLLMQGIQCRSDDGGETFLVTYIMAHERQTWDAEVKAVNSETGQIPAGVTAGDGIETYEIYETANFSALGL